MCCIKNIGKNIGYSLSVYKTISKCTNIMIIRVMIIEMEEGASVEIHSIKLVQNQVTGFSMPQVLLHYEAAHASV